MNTKFTTSDKKVLLDLICNEQVYLLLKDNAAYESERYTKLERLKITVKNM